MEKKVLKLAPNGKRVLAYLIDSIIPFIYLCVALATLAVLGYQEGYNSGNSDMTDPFSMYGFDDGFSSGISSSVSVGIVAALLIMSLLYLVYLAVQIYFYTKSKTIGKAIMGLQVVSSKDGEPVSVWWMLLREWIAKDVSSAIFYIGFIWAFIDDKKRTWHDKICDTYVVEIVKEGNAGQI